MAVHALSSPSFGHPPADNESPGEAAASHLTVLLVELGAGPCAGLERLAAPDLEVEAAPVTEQGVREAALRRHDALILATDGGRDWAAFCLRLRQQSDIPLIVVAPFASEGERTLALEAGADDVVPPSIGAAELRARVRAQDRRRRGRNGPRPGLIRVGPLTLDPGSARARLAGRDLGLTPCEFGLLLTLAEAPGRVLSREQLVERVRGAADAAFDRSVDVHVCHLRSKLGDAPRRPGLIRTVRGLGYALAAPGEG